ncbi:kinetochore protein Spc25-like [Daphnia pulicaria]|uniref:kinetochore protein Spc25-like n=1 Tax=Daphnia pulicaria TaxID=35523 RepID=UPI001EEC9B6C|nr:kinetochore protein Spc25-like [Daphnia pulicaria]
METHVRNFRDRYDNLALLVISNCVKFSKNASNAREEEQRKLKYSEDLAKRIAETEAQTALVAEGDLKVQDKKKKVLQKNAELRAKLKQETIKADDLQSAAQRERSRIEKEEQFSKKSQDKANVLLKPYHDILGVTFQNSTGSEVSLRFIFQMPNGKKCMVKLARNGLKIVKCTPMLKDLEKLETQLAKTNDFSGFVVHLRSLFIEKFTS